MDQVPLGEEARAHETDGGGQSRQIAPDLAYLRAMIANVMFVGARGAGDRNWVLVDAGVMGTVSLIVQAASERFGEGARPSAIILTHGHFDHVGVLESLVERWDVPVYAHALERPYLDGSAAYPSGDPSVGGGMMASLASLYPTKPVNVSSHLKDLPADGSVPSMAGWKWIHTPGHSPGHVSFWRETDRALIVGDAFVTTKAESAYSSALQSPQMHGPPAYFTIDWNASSSSVTALAALRPDLAITGHGRAMQGPAMTSALQTLADTFAQVAVPAHGRYVDHPARASDGSAYVRPD